MTCISGNTGALTGDLTGSGHISIKAFVHWLCTGMSPARQFPTGRSDASLHLCLLQGPSLCFHLSCCRPVGCPLAPDPGLSSWFCFYSSVFPLWLPSRWASRSTTTQRRKDRLRQHSEHIGLDNDLREVGGIICGQHKLVIQEVRFR